MKKRVPLWVVLVYICLMGRFLLSWYIHSSLIWCTYVFFYTCLVPKEFHSRKALFRRLFSSSLLVHTYTSHLVYVCLFFHMSRTSRNSSEKWTLLWSLLQVSFGAYIHVSFGVYMSLCSHVSDLALMNSFLVVSSGTFTFLLVFTCFFGHIFCTSAPRNPSAQDEFL